MCRLEFNKFLEHFRLQVRQEVAMPKKNSAATVNVKKSPSQGEVARLISDSFDMFTNDVISILLQEKNIDRESLQGIRENLIGSAQNVKNRAIDQLLKYY